MAPETRRLAGFLLVVYPTVVFGGVSLLRLLVDDPAYADNQLRQDLWRAGHAHAAVLLLLSLVVLPVFIIPARRVGRKLQEISRRQMNLNAELNTQMVAELMLTGTLQPVAVDVGANLGAFAVPVGLWLRLDQRQLIPHSTPGRLGVGLRPHPWLYPEDLK